MGRAKDRGSTADRPLQKDFFKQRVRLAFGTTAISAAEAIASAVASDGERDEQGVSLFGGFTAVISIAFGVRSATTAHDLSADLHENAVAATRGAFPITSIGSHP